MSRKSMRSQECLKQLFAKGSVWPTNNYGDCVVKQYNNSHDIEVIFLDTAAVTKTNAYKLENKKTADPTRTNKKVVNCAHKGNKVKIEKAKKAFEDVYKDKIIYSPAIGLFQIVSYKSSAEIQCKFIPSGKPYIAGAQHIKNLAKQQKQLLQDAEYTLRQIKQSSFL